MNSKFRESTILPAVKEALYHDTFIISLDENECAGVITITTDDIGIIVNS